MTNQSFSDIPHNEKMRKIPLSFLLNENKNENEAICKGMCSTWYSYDLNPVNLVCNF